MEWLSFVCNITYSTIPNEQNFSFFIIPAIENLSQAAKEKYPIENI